MKQWYEILFDSYSSGYEEEIYTKGTSGECDFFELEFKHNKNIKILDVGCGTGRHSIELARRGYVNVTGIDLSQAMLERAREKARTLNLIIRFEKQDARNFSLPDKFDAAIMICEGGFSLMETDEMNFDILKSVSQALNDNGIFIFTTLNGLFPLFHSVKDFMESNKVEGNSELSEINFDLMTFREKSILNFKDDSGNDKELICNERYYVPSEITWLLKSLNFKKIDIFGSVLGAFSRESKLTTNDFEMLVIAEK